MMTNAVNRVRSAVAKRSIASGNFVVGAARDEILEAYLGTCLGVALWDEEARIGGLIHLLLPEPTGPDTWAPAAYASTGMPLFLKALLDAGASEKRVRACVAGGALVGPVSDLDLDLNIGGRTAELVETFLNSRNIPLQKAETGGFFTCRLSLDMRTMESRIDPLEPPHDPCEKGPYLKPSPDDIEQSVECIRPIPQIALKILHMVKEGRYSFEDTGREIRQDQVLSAKVIRLCHSAFFGAKLGADSVDRALIMLGEKRLLQLVVSASMEDFFPEGTNGYSLCKGGLYKHALGMAAVCEMLSGLTGKAPADIAYTAGLLHDIGKVVLDQHLAKADGLFYRRVQNEGANSIAAEKELLGATHTEVGALLAKKWSLPEVLTDAILHHHSPEGAAAYPHLAHIVYLADLILSRFMIGQEMERVPTKGLPVRLSMLGLTSEIFPSVVEKVHMLLLDGRGTQIAC